MKKNLKRIITKTLSLCLAILLSFSYSSAQTKTIDLRTYTESNGNTYYLVFTASKPNGGTGHSFITFGFEDRRGRQSKMASYGQYSTGGINILGKAPGKIIREKDYLFNSRNSAKLIVKVNRQNHDKAWRIVQKYKKTGQYQLISRDCAAMVLTAAKSTGLKTPRRSLVRNAYPYTMLKSLISLN